MQKIPEKNKNQAKPNKAFWHAGAVVGTVHSTGGLRAAANLKPDLLDAVEIRLDALNPTTEQLKSIALPTILTPRCKSEGGAIDWTPEERIEKALPLLSYASAVDIELAQVQKMGHLIKACEAKQIPVILSFHDFEKTPTVARLQRLLDRARGEGAVVFKTATMLRAADDLANLLRFVGAAETLPVSVMGMGGLGRVSRISLAVSGSVLNYGWLHRPQVPGQWPAAKLRALIVESQA